MKFLTTVEEQILGMVSESPKTFTQINQFLNETDDLRPSTVSGLVRGLVNGGYLLENTGNGFFIPTS